MFQRVRYTTIKLTNMEHILDKYSDLKTQYDQQIDLYDALLIKYNYCLEENVKMKKTLDKPSNIFKSLAVVYFVIFQCYNYGFVNEGVMIFANILLMSSGSMYALLIC